MSDPLQAAIGARLAEVVGQAEAPPPWYAAWKRLGPGSSDEERLAVYRAVRDAGSVPEAAGFYLVSWQVDQAILGQVEEVLRGQEDELDAIRRRHGLGEDDAWPPGEGPPEYEEAIQKYHDAWDGLYAAKLDALGEHAMAQLFRTDRARFDQLSEEGQQFFHGPGDEGDADPAWLIDL